MTEGPFPGAFGFLCTFSRDFLVKSLDFSGDAF